MREVFATIAQWLGERSPFAAGTLVETYDSVPAPLGATIAVDANSRVAGNIGAGCYESEIVEACLETITDGKLRVLPINLAGTDELTGSAGCGGALKVAVWKPRPEFATQARIISRGFAGCTVTLPGGFRFTIPGKRRLVVVGATTLAQEIARAAKPLDYSVSVVDPRPIFATPERIPDAVALVREWPDDALPRLLPEAHALVVVSHDPKFDLPALRCGLESAVPYIGLLGSRRSQAARRDALRAMGFGGQELTRIHGPAGLDLGGATAAETALSILAQIVALAHSREGGPLDASGGAIHDRLEGKVAVR